MKRLLFVLLLVVGCNGQSIKDMRITLELLEEQATDLKEDVRIMTLQQDLANRGKFNQRFIDEANKASVPGMTLEESIEHKTAEYEKTTQRIEQLKRSILEATE